MVNQIDLFREEFLQASKTWNVEKLFTDLGDAKKTLVPRSKNLSRTEKIFLCLLLCEQSPDTIAKKLYRSINGVKAELSKGLYTYIEVLVGQRPKNWRQIIIWFEQKGYKLSSSDSNLELSPSTGAFGWIDSKESLSNNYNSDNKKPELTKIQEQALKNLEAYKRYTNLVGREKEISNIYNTLIDINSRSIIAIDGIGGVGKTALAREIAIRLLKKGEFYSVIWESAKPEEFTPLGKSKISAATIDIDKLLTLIASNLGYLDVYSIQDIKENITLYSEFLMSKPTLLS